jgi:RNase P subunit RPR2
MDEENIVCSNCKAPLVKVWPRQTNSVIAQSRVTKISVDCPHCGDVSYIKEITGEFYIGSTDYTYFVNFEIEGEISRVRTERIKEYE